MAQRWTVRTRLIRSIEWLVSAQTAFLAIHLHFLKKYNRDSVGFYAELGVDLSESLFVQAALRYEDYSDFGSETVYKVAGRYSFSETFGLRTSYNTGFRAPPQDNKAPLTYRSTAEWVPCSHRSVSRWGL